MINLSNKKVLIVRLGKIGDIIISSFVFELLKKRYPGIEISVLTLKSNQDVLKYNVDIDNLILTKKNLSLYLKLFKLRKNYYDLVIDLNDDPSTTSNVIRRIIKAKRIVGFSFLPDTVSKDNFQQPPKDKTHIINRIKFLLEQLDISITNDEVHPKLYLGSKEYLDVKNQINNFKDAKMIVALNLSAGADIRIWDANNWVELISKISKEHSEIIFITLSTEYDTRIKDEINKKIASDLIINQLYYSFHHYASYIYISDLIISPDTAAVHIGSAFNKPIIAMYPNYEWNFVSWLPLSEKYIAMKSKTNFINSITVDEVAHSFNDLYEQLLH